MERAFAWLGRNRRLSDLVMYHVVLKCYCIIDLKTRKLSHGDLGQIQLYVNYFDQEVKMPDDNPTIGLILCTAKNDKMVKYTLGEKGQQIFASKYPFYLPTVEELEKELRKEINYQLNMRGETL